MSDVTWTKSQKYAIDCRDRDLLLSAGAGSGKTATLTERVCRLVCDEENGIDTSRLLVVTFTKAAASQLRDKIRKKLEAAIAKDPSSRRLAKQLIDLDRADISTISSFLLKSIRPYFSRFALPVSFSVADETELQIMKERIIDEVADDFFDSGDDDFIALCEAVSSAKNESSVNSVLLSLAETLRGKGFSAEQCVKWANELDDASQNDFLSSSYGNVIREITVSFAAHYLSSFERIKEEIFKEEKLGASKYGISATEHVDFLRRLSASLQNGTYSDVKDIFDLFKPVSLQVGRAKFESADTVAAYKELRGDFKDGYSTVAALYKWDKENIASVEVRCASLLRALASVIGEFEARFAEEKRNAGVSSVPGSHAGRARRGYGGFWQLALLVRGWRRLPPRSDGGRGRRAGARPVGGDAVL